MTNENQNDSMTLDRLGRMVAKGFEGVDKRLDNVDQRISHLETRLESVDRRLGVIGLNVSDMREAVARLETGDILNLQKRMQTVERQVKTLSKPS